MTYSDRIKEIIQNFIMGITDRETCFQKFEDLLHEYTLLPAEESLDRGITNENFLALLKLAQKHTPQQPAAQAAQQALDAYQQALTRPHYRISDSILQTCPVCKQKVNGIYNRMVGAEQQSIPVDPPRCKACMMKWIEEKFGGDNKPKPEPLSLSVDTSPASPMDAAETDFFSQYEAEMKDFKP